MSGISRWIEQLRYRNPKSPDSTWFNGTRARYRKRRLYLEPLEGRRMLASDLALISGTVFDDQTGDGQSGDDVLLSGVTVRLFRDGGDTVFGGDDTLEDTQTTDASGNYAFANLAAGRYFVQQTIPNGFMVRPGEDVVTVDISAGDAAGTSGLTIDSFESAQMVSGSSAGPTSDSSTQDDAAVLGGERDLFVEVLSGMGVVSLESDFVGMGVLQLSSNGNAVGQAEVVWDGDDNDATTINETGLGGIDLTDSGGNLMTAFLLQAGADQTGAQLTIDVFTDASNSSSMTMAIPNTGGTADATFCIPFAAFSVTSGTGADFASVGAIRMMISSGATAVDTQVALTGTVGPTIFDVDFANSQPLSIGNLVWSDADNDGLFDSGTESGIQGVTVQLYKDTDLSGDLDPGNDTLIDTTTTDASGAYLFEDVFAGTYIVLIPQSQFDPGGPLAGMVSSTGNDPSPDPDNDVDDDDNGTPLAMQGVVSGTITLSTGDEPTDDGDSDPNSNLSVDFGFFAEVDLELVLSESADPAAAGDSLTYTLMVTNNGSAAATGVVLTDTLPAEAAFDSANATQGDTPAEVDGVVTANLGTLAAGASATVTIVVIVDPSFSGSITNAASVVANENDTNTADNSASEETMVALQTDLEITKLDDTDPIVPGQTLTYSIEVTNHGPSNASGVSVSDTLPAGVTFVSATSSQGNTPSHAGGVVTAVLGDLAAQAMATLTIEVTVDSSTTGTIDNVASVTSTTSDPDTDNNSATQSTAVTPEIDLAISKSDSSDPALAGEQLTYTLTVSNNGPADATGVTLTDTLPAGVTFSSANASQGNPPSETGGVVTAELGTLAAGASATVTIVVDIGPNTLGIITNTATVTANEPDTDSANDMVSEATEVEIEPASLSGRVFVDFDNDGLFDPGDVPLPGVTITLTGSDITSGMVNRTTTTGADGTYLFDELLPGTYRIEQTQPGFFPDGQETVGSAGGTAMDNVFEMIDLMGGVDGLDYNFAELVPTLSKRQFLASSGG